MRLIANRFCVLCNRRIGFDSRYIEDASGDCYMHFSCVTRPVPQHVPLVEPPLVTFHLPNPPKPRYSTDSGAQRSWSDVRKTAGAERRAPQ
jgi:hypothetical protein